MSYTTDEKIRYYIDAQGSTGIGTTTLGTYKVSLSQRWADSIIDLKLSKRYSVPFGTASIPPAVESMSTTLSAWDSLRSLFSGEIPSNMQQIKDEYDRVMVLLDDIQKGVLDIPTGTDGSLVGEAGASTKYWSSTMDYTPTFDVDDELQWNVDTDRLDDIEGRRE